MKKLGFCILLILVLLPLLALAQDTGDFPYPLNKELILQYETILGIGLFAIIQLAKQAMKKYLNFDNWTKLARHASVYTVSLILSAAATWYILTGAQKMSLGPFVLYTVWAWGVANGFWKALKELIKKHAGATG